MVLMVEVRLISHTRNDTLAFHNPLNISKIHVKNQLNSKKQITMASFTDLETNAKKLGL